MESVKCKDY